MRCKLSDICSYRKGKIEVKRLNNITYISTENMLPNKGGITEASSLPSIVLTQEYRKGDVLVSNIRPYFKKIWQAKYDGGCSNDVLVFTPDPMTDKDFLYYVLANDEFFLYSMATSKGTKMPRGDKDSIMQYEIPDIGLDRQRKIASVLKSLDDKIQLNIAINNNLEQQAQAIFLKMFPDIFSTSASSSFQNLIEFSNGKKRPEAIGDIPVYGGNGILAYTNQSNAENCVIIGRVGAYCGNTFLCPEKCWTSDNAIQAKSKNEDSQLFIYYLLRNASLPSRHIGTGQPLMTQAILNAVPVNEPSTQEIRSFINDCTPLHEIIFANEKQNISLTLLRDTLLPKLMSGELDVSDIDL